ncbi:MAG: DUF5691 domain-containing protein [Beijerinckiaceae bacterium]|jgi:hypothetical protein|nr:DUF5691 domain-containing protein [Beijerinckiaceae bacterium]
MIVDQGFVQRVTHHLSLGLARAPLPAEGAGPVAADAPLALLAMAGQARRFIRSALPDRFDPPRESRDDRPLVSDAARGLLQAIKPTTGTTELAIADLMEKRRLRLHPFDLPALASFVKAYAEQLGESAIAFASSEGEKEPQTNDFFDASIIDETNWIAASPARKSGFIRTLRTQDPARARDIVQAGFAGQHAPARVKVLQAFVVGLARDDIPFLESLAGDRAPSVRTLAEQLLSRLPGTPAYAARLTDVMSRLSLVYSGLLRRRAEIRIEYPATINEWQRPGWLFEILEGLPLDGLAKGLGLSVDEMAAAAQKADRLSIALARQAIVEQRFSLAASLLATDGEDLELLLSGEGPDLDLLADPAIGGRFAEAVLRPETWQTLPQAGFFDRLYRRLRRPLPETTLAGLARLPVWQVPVPATRADDAAAILLALVPLVTPGYRPLLRQALAGLPLASSHRPRLVVDLFDELAPP